MELLMKKEIEIVTLLNIRIIMSEIKSMMQAYLSTDPRLLKLFQ
jgi:hypothetical protein